MARLGIILHGVTGRMGYNQHLVRSILAFCDQGGITLKSGEKLEIDPENLVFLFQGVSDEHRAGKPYGQIPWKLGLLTLGKED